jgi:hypothetical protein
MNGVHERLNARNVVKTTLTLQNTARNAEHH